MSEPAATGNFLTRLASQAHGEAPALSSRLPALFESVPPLQSMPPDADGVSGEPHSMPSQAQTGPGSTTTRSSDTRDAVARRVPSAPRARRATPVDTSPGDGQPVQVSSPTPMAPTTSATRRRARPTDAAPASGALESTVAGFARRHPAVADSALQVDDGAPDRGSVGTTPALDRSLAPRVLRAGPAAESIVVRASPPDGAVQPRSAMDAYGRPPSVSGGHAAEPVIRVSIGRIEVRAVAASSPAASKPERPRPTRLDDYLQQRGRTR